MKFIDTSGMYNYIVSFGMVLELIEGRDTSLIDTCISVSASAARGGGACIAAIISARV